MFILLIDLKLQMETVQSQFVHNLIFRKYHQLYVPLFLIKTATKVFFRGKHLVPVKQIILTRVEIGK